MQNPETGLFTEATHSEFHTTAHCLAALELFDAKPLYPVYAAQKYKDVDTLYAFLESLDWKHKPWPQSHGGAGIFAIMNLADLADMEWNEAYFQWLWEHTDEETGLIGRTDSPFVTAKKYEFMGGTFHYLFNMEYARMPLRYPEKLIDACLWMYENRAANSAGKSILFRWIGFTALRALCDRQAISMQNAWQHWRILQSSFWTIWKRWTQELRTGSMTCICCLEQSVHWQSFSRP